MSNIIKSLLSDSTCSISAAEITAAKKSNYEVTMAYRQKSGVNQPLVMVAHEIDGHVY